MNKITVIHHSADYDGLFSREIARKFLPPDTQFIGWDFGDKPIEGKFDTVYVIDLPCDAPFGCDRTVPFSSINSTPITLGFMTCNQLVWIDHHKSAIDSHPKDIPGYRIDGVAACRLTWAWFKSMPEHATPNFAGRGVEETLPTKQQFIDRIIEEPLAVRLAGEYDIWDKRDPRAEIFQFGL